MRVSILVLVDVALEPVMGWIPIWFAMSFNPCSRGCRSGTLVLALILFGGKEFQSLFSWMSLWNWKFGVGIDPLDKFQSLFSWMSLWNKFKVDFKVKYAKLFQSLFSWMSLWNIMERGL